MTGPGRDSQTFLLIRRLLLCFALLGCVADFAHAQASTQPDNPPLRRSVERAEAGAEPTPVTTPTGSAMEPGRVVLALSLVVGLIFFLRWLCRGVFAAPATAGTSGAIQVLSRFVLAPKQQLIVVRVGRRVLVVGDSGAQMNALTEITDADEIATLCAEIRAEQAQQPLVKFQSLFGRAKRSFEEEPAEMPTPMPRVGLVAEDQESEVEESAATRDEISGLMEKVRLLSSQFRQSES